MSPIDPTVNGPIPHGASLKTEDFFDHPTWPACQMANLIQFDTSGRYFLLCERKMYDVPSTWAEEQLRKTENRKENPTP